jgi:hypothetical protein
MNTYSFRAESSYDVETFRKRISSFGTVVQFDVQPLLLLVEGKTRDAGDLTVELKTQLPLHILMQCLREQQDSQVMLQTLRQEPLANNSLKRDYGFC